MCSFQSQGSHILKRTEAGTAQIRSVKLVLLGEDRSGKSSVLASVSGAGWEAHRQSTHGISASRFKLSRQGWTKQEGGLSASEVAADATAALMRVGTSADEGQAQKQDVGKESAGQGASASGRALPAKSEQARVLTGYLAIPRQNGNPPSHVCFQVKGIAGPI